VSAIGTCDVCSGPANWCLDASGDVWELCKDAGCPSHLQLDLFPEEPLWGEGVASASEGGDPEGQVASDQVTPVVDLDDGLPF